MLTLALVALLAGGAYTALRSSGHRKAKHEFGDTAVATSAPDKGSAAEGAEAEGAEKVEDEAEASNAHALVQADPKQALERKLQKSLISGWTGLGLASAGALLVPPLGALSIPFLMYAALPLFESAYQAVTKEKRLRAVVLDATAFTAVLVGQYYVLGAIGVLGSLISRKLLLKTEDRTRQNLANIFNEQPRFVWVVQNGVELQVPFKKLRAGDLIVVTAAQVVPVDGVIREGTASIDQHMLTGEAQPAEKGPGEQVFAATMVLSGRIYVEATQTGSATVAAQIGEILQRTADYRDTVHSRGERLVDQSVIPLLAATAVGAAVKGPAAAVAIVNSNYLGSMRVAVPLSMLNFLDRAIRQRILIKDGRALDLLNGVDTVAFDKTGTLTLEQPQVRRIHVCSGLSEDALMTYAAAAEARQNHPIARAILRAAEELSLPLPALGPARYQLGYGLEAEIGQHRVKVGSARFMAHEGIVLPESLRDLQEQAHQDGHSMVYVAIDDELAGALELQPSVRSEAREVIDALRRRGLMLYLISGDQRAPTERLAAELGIEHCFAEVLPEDKATLVTRLKQEGRKVCFVGDGINDSIALRTADSSISLSGATTVATDTAQIILMDGSLRQLPQLFQLASEYDANVRGSLMATMAPSLLAIGGVLFLNFGLGMTTLLWYPALLASLGNAMLPTLKTKAGAQKNDRQQLSSIGP